VDTDELDTQRVVAAIRRSLKARIDEGSSSVPAPALSAPASPPPPPKSPFIVQDLGVLRAASDIGHTALRSHRKVVGRVVILLKKLVRQLMKPVLDQQVVYNAAAVRLFEAFNGRVNEADAELHRRTAELDHRTDALQEESTACSAEFNRRIATLQAEWDRRTVALQAELERRMVALPAELERRMVALQAELERRTVALQAELDRRTVALQAGVGRRLTQEEQETAALDMKLGHTLVELQTTREQVARAERKLRRILHAAGSPAEKSELSATAEARSGPPSARVDSDFDYAGFEERFRGSEAEIKRRHRRYLRHMNGDGPVLDIGCGRGEFLELLRESGIEARGVDLNLDMVLLCREKGLEVWHGDAFAYLGDVPDGSLGGIFSAQFIEHFPPRDIIRLTQVCYRKLKPRGVLLFETVNPGCLTVFARSFFLDPSHVWPFHPETLRFLFEGEGFREISVEFASPVETSSTLPHVDASMVGADASRFNRCVDLLNELVFGYQDFAIVGRKHFAEAVTDSVAGND
jgi:SAM-dependent methyltransferase